MCFAYNLQWEESIFIMGLASENLQVPPNFQKTLDLLLRCSIIDFENHKHYKKWLPLIKLSNQIAGKYNLIYPINDDEDERSYAF